VDPPCVIHAVASLVVIEELREGAEEKGAGRGKVAGDSLRDANKNRLQRHFQSHLPS
jgi:hypothetical protein